MITFEVNDMSCGHCAGVITEAVKEIDGAARVQIDIERHRVSVAASTASADDIREAILEAGYTPTPVA